MFMCDTGVRVIIVSGKTVQQADSDEHFLEFLATDAS